MFIKHLELNDFRNYETASLSFSERVVIFYGANAQGKTNLLEAMHFIALGKSHRTNRERNCIRWGRPFARINADAEASSDEYRLEVQLTPKGKKVKRNGVEQRRVSDYIGTLRTVLFAPEDLSIVKGSPGKRRRFLDVSISQMSPAYLYHLSQYNKILAQRNALLKSLPHIGSDASLLDVLTEQLIAFGAPLVLKRQQFIQKLEAWAAAIQAGITGGLEQLALSYRTFVDASETIDVTRLKQMYGERLHDRAQRERERGMTLVGPHLDDLSFTVNGMDVQTYGSQGQQRTVALALKLAEIELIYEETGEYPVLLLDDVLSELDPLRQTHLIESIRQKVQTFITTTSTEGIDTAKFREEATVYEVREGKVR